MARVDSVFAIILVWGVVTTMLVNHLTHTNSAVHRQRTENQARVTRPKADNGETKNRDHHKGQNRGQQLREDRGIQKKTSRRQKSGAARRNESGKGSRERQPSDDQRLRQTPGVSAGQSPLTRSLETFEEPSGFLIYVVHIPSESGNPSPLEWREVRWGDLAAYWGRDTSFDDILQMSTELNNELGIKSASMKGVMKKKLILHCLPKTASTTLREACVVETSRKCEALFTRKSPYGYRNINDFFRAVRECTNINHFCIQGGSLEMDVMNFEDREKGDREPYHFLHMVPFRKFDDWVDSAIRHIFSVDGHCDRVGKLLDQCLGYRELYMELYTKSALSLLIGMTLRSNQNGIPSKDKHHILLYNYEDTESAVSQVSNLFGIDPLRRTDRKHKEKSKHETCPDSISIAKKFHDCHDHTLLKPTVISDFAAEERRRKKNYMTMKDLVIRSRREGY
jgi:hypothetical protein